MAQSGATRSNVVKSPSVPFQRVQCSHDLMHIAAMTCMDVINDDAGADPQGEGVDDPHRSIYDR